MHGASGGRIAPAPAGSRAPRQPTATATIPPASARSPHGRDHARDRCRRYHPGRVHAPVESDARNVLQVNDEVQEDGKDDAGRGAAKGDEWPAVGAGRSRWVHSPCPVRPRWRRGSRARASSVRRDAHDVAVVRDEPGQCDPKAGVNFVRHAFKQHRPSSSARLRRVVARGVASGFVEPPVSTHPVTPYPHSRGPRPPSAPVSAPTIEWSAAEDAAAAGAFVAAEAFVAAAVAVAAARALGSRGAARCVVQPTRDGTAPAAATQVPRRAPAAYLCHLAHHRRRRRRKTASLRTRLPPRTLAATTHQSASWTSRRGRSGSSSRRRTCSVRRACTTCTRSSRSCR